MSPKAGTAVGYVQGKMPVPESQLLIKPLHIRPYAPTGAHRIDDGDDDVLIV